MWCSEDSSLVYSYECSLTGYTWIGYLNAIGIGMCRVVYLNKWNYAMYGWNKSKPLIIVNSVLSQTLYYSLTVHICNCFEHLREKFFCQSLKSSLSYICIPQKNQMYLKYSKKSYIFQAKIWYFPLKIIFIGKNIIKIILNNL